MRTKSNTNNKKWNKLFLERLLNFAVRIIKLASKLPKTPAGFAIASQLIKAGTLIGTNAEEAQGASSSRDFIQKLSIVLREAKERHYRLKVIEMARLLSISDVDEKLAECDEIIVIPTSSIKSSRAKLI